MLLTLVSPVWDMSFQKIVIKLVKFVHQLELLCVLNLCRNYLLIYILDRTGEVRSLSNLMRNQLENPALPRLLIVTHAVYPRLVLNYEFSHFSSRPTQLRIAKPAKNIHVVLPNQNLRQIGQGFMSYDRTFKKAKKTIATLNIQIRSHNNLRP